MQNTPRSYDDPLVWPPGTVTLEALRYSTEGDEEGFDIILVPKPTAEPNDPLNWKPWEKYLNIGLTLLYSSIVFALISAITPTWAPMNIELGFSYVALNNSYATGSGTLAIGALIFIPFALKYGRRPVYLFSLLGQFAVAIWAARMKTTADLYLTQAFNCLLGALAEVIVQMTIADVFFVHERGLMNNLYVCTMTIGTNLAALLAGYITVGQGWRWVWLWVAIIVGGCFLLFAFFYEETKFTPFINGVTDIETTGASSTDNQQFKKTDPKSGDNHYIKPVLSASTLIAPPRKSYLQRLKPVSATSRGFRQLSHHIYQPIFVMCTIPAVTYVALLYGLVTAALQVSITLVAAFMPAPPYNFTASQIGLMGLPPFIGTVIGTVLSAPFADRIIIYFARRNKGIYEPEMRLWLLLVFAPLFPAGLILFGYALGKGMSWPVVALGQALMSCAMAPIASVALSYLADAYTDIIADSVVGVTFMRNVLATTFVFATTPWVERVGLHYAMLTFAMITALLLGVGTVGLIFYGKRLRTLTIGRYRVYAKRQMDTRD
ncbi:MFS general substrate transporter [Plenodomus tracheiphilus IPT5]|uniref:MFS general substrate transporter n=1 Tax=Plenodomus tracheiphilus IPT5 TaxID=1408161 RepID=A0A6A7BDW0_9PLEO|nr:MFS general substrate transporter [Plenodomus tracheiphilus IPT5]